MKIEHREPYRTLRKRSYPDHGEQLDSIWKILLALQTGSSIPTDAAMVQARILEIKKAVPKT